jgi:hypothetical protein
MVTHAHTHARTRLTTTRYRHHLDGQWAKSFLREDVKDVLGNEVRACVRVCVCMRVCMRARACVCVVASCRKW